MEFPSSTNDATEERGARLSSGDHGEGGHPPSAAARPRRERNTATETAELTTGERAERRLALKRRQIAQSEQREPLRRRILESLADAPATPSALAKELDAAVESISRQLAALREDDLVVKRPVPGDARRRQYLLTPAGEVQLSQHRAFGTPDPAPDPTPVQTLRFLQSALANAVRMRRKTNKLDDAKDRLEVVVEQAYKAQAHELAVEALAELATTLRQGRNFTEVTTVLAALDGIALGHDPGASAALALPAAAHREYALGRLDAEHGGDLATRSSHLMSAANLYGQLADAPSCGSSLAWRERQAWSIVSLANNLRARSQFDAALECADRALGLFEELEDSYGRSRCLFMLGFCLRLLGHFDGAWDYLADAHELARAHSFERFQADSLMQMGEVRRCQGNLDDARAMLDESLERSKLMCLTVTQAFAQSARGAVEYQEHRLDEAAIGLKRAHALFEACGYQEGLALNARRWAVVARTAGSRASGDRATVQALIDEAFRRYADLRSPAGVAACEIELGRLQLRYDGRVRDTIGSLIWRLDDPDQRDLLELDPWVPHVLHGFAQEVDDEDAGFAERTRRLLTAAERRLAERARHSVQRTVEAIDQVKQQFERRGANFTMDEMGGETRLHQASIEVPQLIGS